MQKRLYFICPTDHLESIINDRYKEENYYLTSLGNSISFDFETVEQLNSLVLEKEISHITFVLSDTNSIIEDALLHQNFGNLQTLKPLHSEILKQKKLADKVWHTSSLRVLVATHYLSCKIDELHHQLSSWMTKPIKIDAKIYHRKQARFTESTPDLLLLRYFHLN